MPKKIKTKLLKKEVLEEPKIKKVLEEPKIKEVLEEPVKVAKEYVPGWDVEEDRKHKQASA